MKPETEKQRVLDTLVAFGDNEGTEAQLDMCTKLLEFAIDNLTPSRQRVFFHDPLIMNFRIDWEKV